MRTASYIGLFVAVAVAVGAFVLFDQWWLRILLVLVALAIGWYSLGLFARASTGSAYRAIRGVASDEDLEEIGRLGASASREAIRAAAEAPDPQRDRIYGDFLNRVGGLAAAQELVVDHLAGHGFEIGADTAYDLLDSWRKYGIVRDESLGEFLDDQVSHLDGHLTDTWDASDHGGGTPVVRVYAIVDVRGSHYQPPDEAAEVFVRRSDAERVLEQVRSDDPRLAARLRIEERRSDASAGPDGRSSRLPTVSASTTWTVWRAYFGDEITEDQLAFDAGLKIESMFIAAQRVYLIEVLRRLEWLIPSEDGSYLEVVPGREDAFRGWSRGASLYPWEDRVSRAGRRRRRIQKGLRREWEASGHIRAVLPALIKVHPSRLGQ